jgi:hypothetical protein
MGHITKLASSSAGTAVTPGVVTMSLTSPSTAVSLPPIGFIGGMWILLLEQDGTGGRLVTFPAGYSNADALPGMLLSDLNTYSVLTFYYRSDGKQLLTGILTNIPLP